MNTTAALAKLHASWEQVEEQLTPTLAENSRPVESVAVSTIHTAVALLQALSAAAHGEEAQLKRNSYENPGLWILTERAYMSLIVTHSVNLKYEIREMTLSKSGENLVAIISNRGFTLSVSVLSFDGTVIRSFDGDFGQNFYDLCVDWKGRIWVCDFNKKILCFTEKLDLVSVTPTEFHPTAITCLDERILIAGWETNATHLFVLTPGCHESIVDTDIIIIDQVFRVQVCERTKKIYVLRYSIADGIGVYTIEGKKRIQTIHSHDHHSITLTGNDRLIVCEGRHISVWSTQGEFLCHHGLSVQPSSVVTLLDERIAVVLKGSKNILFFKK